MVYAVPGRTELALGASLKASQSVSPSESVPGGLYPLKARAFELDEYRVLMGRPVSIPPLDVRVMPLISIDGEMLTDRPDDTEVSPNSLIRWIAEDSYYDETSLVWRAFTDRTGRGPVWTSTVDYLPTFVTSYSYRVDNEVFTRNALNFDSDSRQHMWADLGSILSPTAYTVVMVLSPSSAFGNSTDDLYNGLWCPAEPTQAGDTFTETFEEAWTSVTMEGNYIYLQSETAPRQQTVAIGTEINSTAPLFLAMVLTRPSATLYAGPGPNAIRSKTVTSGADGVPLHQTIALGRSSGDVLHTADMALFEINLYADPLTPAQVAEEFAILSQCYGGDR